MLSPFENSKERLAFALRLVEEVADWRGHEHLIQISSEVFGLEVRPFTEVEKLTSESRFYYKLDEAPVFFSVDVTPLYQLLPRKWARFRLLKKLLRKIPERVGMNCGRVRYDFVERMDKSYRQFKVALSMKKSRTSSLRFGVLWSEA